MNLRTALAAVPLALCCAGASAGPGYYVVTVYDNPGVKTLDFRYWTVKSPGSSVVEWPELGFGWNVTGRWYTEVLASYIGSADSATKLDTLNWQNDFLLTQGQYPIDLALHTQVIWPNSDKGGYSLEFGPALQTDFGRTQVNLNVFFERGFGGQAEYGTQMKYQWQLRNRLWPWLHVGAQGFGELGQWDDWAPSSAQSHRAGPALFGSVRLGGGGTLGWHAGYLWGKTYGSRGDMFTAQLKYEWGP